MASADATRPSPHPSIMTRITFRFGVIIAFMGCKSIPFAKVLFILHVLKNTGLFMAYFSLLAGRINDLYMKKIVTLTCAALFLVLSAFKPANGIDDVINALRTGSATELAKYIDANVELALPSKADNYSRQQAVVILQDFFSTNGIKGFDVKHRGDNGGSQYCVGTLVTKSGNYRTTIFMMQKNGKESVKEIRFQPM